MKRVGVVLAGLVCLASADVRADANSPLIDGDYHVGSFGVLHLTSTAIPTPSTGQAERFAVRGTYVSSDKCAFSPAEVLLEGSTEGSVLVATFIRCLEGSGCQSPSKLSLMAVISEGLLVGYIRLPKGCEARLDQRVTMELDPKTLREAGANFIAATPPNFGRAARAWKRLSELPQFKDDIEVLLQLGSALNGMKEYQEGKKVFERALRQTTFASANGETRTMVLYNLGCSESGLSEKDPAQAALALDHLKQAVEIARANRINLAKFATDDGDLAPIRGTPEFQKLFGLTKKGPR